MVHGFKASSTMNVTEPLDINGHISINPMFKPKGPMYMNNSALEPVLFEKLHDIKLSHSVLRVTTSFQFTTTKMSLQTLLQYVHDFKDSLRILYSKLVNNNDCDHKSYDVRQCV